MSKNANRFLYLYLFSYLILNLLDYFPNGSESSLIEYEVNLIDDVYYVVTSFFTVGVFYLLYSFGKNNISLRNNKEFVKLIITILAYSTWALIVNILILVGLGSPGTPFYSIIDLAIITTGILWSFVLKR